MPQTPFDACGPLRRGKFQVDSATEKEDNAGIAPDWHSASQHRIDMGNDKNGNGLAELEKRLWAAEDRLWANSPLRPSEILHPGPRPHLPPVQAKLGMKWGGRRLLVG